MSNTREVCWLRLADLALAETLAEYLTGMAGNPHSVVIRGDLAAIEVAE